MRRALIILGLALLAAGMASLSLPRIFWDGAAGCTLDIVVRDAQGTPIPNTTLILKYADFSMDPRKRQEFSNYTITRSKTDANGKGKITHAFPAGGSRWLLFQTGRIGFNGINVLAEHGDYLSKEIAVSDYSGSHRSIRASRTIQIEIKLTQQDSAP